MRSILRLARLLSFNIADESNPASTLPQLLVDTERDALRRGQRPQGDDAAELRLAGHRHQRRRQGGGVRGRVSMHGTQRTRHRRVQQRCGPPVK